MADRVFSNNGVVTRESADGLIETSTVNKNGMHITEKDVHNGGGRGNPGSVITTLTIKQHGHTDTIVEKNFSTGSMGAASQVQTFNGKSYDQLSKEEKARADALEIKAHVALGDVTMAEVYENMRAANTPAKDQSHLHRGGGK